MEKFAELPTDKAIIQFNLELPGFILSSDPSAFPVPHV